MANIVDERGYNQVFESSPAQALRLRRRAEAMVQEMNLPQTPEERQRVHILEIGCGMGDLAHHLTLLTGARVTGVDLSPLFVGQAAAKHQHPQLKFAVVDLGKSMPDSERGIYDYIVGNGILHHLYYQLDTILPGLAQRLRVGGRLIFWEPNLYNPYIFAIFSWRPLRCWALLEPDEMAFTPDFIRDKLRQAGFESIEVSTRDFLLPNTPAPLTRLVIMAGWFMERIPLIRRLAQSVFIRASRPAS